MLLLLKSDARWPESHLNQAYCHSFFLLPLLPPSQTGEPARTLSYPSFAQPGPGESAVLV